MTWFEEGDSPARIAQFRALSERSEGSWRFMRDSSGQEGMLIADGAVWHFGCSGCPEMITGGPIAPERFLADNDPAPSGASSDWARLCATVCARLRELGYRSA